MQLGARVGWKGALRIISRLVGNYLKEITSDDSFGHYEVYLVSPQLKGESRASRIDTRLQASLVKE
jgi:hypothetical protein